MGTAETALLVISDLHYGKSTPSYNPDVFKQRMAGLDDKIRDIKKCLGTYKFDGLRVAILGDAVDGSEIFATQPHHQAVSSAEQQSYELSGLLAEWLVGQKKVWRNLSVDCVTGNHGRQGHFAHENSNFDLVTYRYLQHSLKGKIDVHFDPLQPFIRKLDIHGNKILLYHGHEIRSFANIPWYGISMRVNRWLSTGFAPFDTVFMGHFHTTGYWPINRIKLFCTGTMVTDDDYPLLGMGLESSNKWWLVGVHPERGITFSFDLDLVN